MHLNVDRIGPVLSDRLVLDSKLVGIEGLHADHSLLGWILRIISWIYSPCCYTSQNRRTIACVQKYLIGQIGQDRLNRVCSRYSMDLEAMKSSGDALLSRHVAKIMTGIKDVKIEDIEELIELANSNEPWPETLDPDLREDLRGESNAKSLSSDQFAAAYKALSEMGRFAIVPSIKEVLMSGAEPTEFLACRFYDPFLADRERLSLSEENPNDSFGTFVHNFVVRIIGREMDVGMLIPAPKRSEVIGEDGDENAIYSHKPQFYRVSAKIISGEGMVSYVLSPTTDDSSLKTIRFFRGTSTRASAIDSASTMITDMEKDLGRSAFESGEIYEDKLKEVFGKITLAAGHSLGSTTLQYILVENGDIEEAWFFNGPGLPPEEVEKFNERMRLSDQKLKLYIRDTNTDIFSTVGTHHLGYQAPLDKVDVDYLKYFPRAKTLIGHAHVQVPDRENRFIGIQGFSERESIDVELNRKENPNRLIFCTSNEALRQAIGPCIAAIIRFVRNIFRWICGSRTLEQRGIQYGTYNQAGKWTKFHVRPEDLVAQREFAALEPQLVAAAT